MTMIRDTGWGASASSSAFFAPEVSHPISICSSTFPSNVAQPPSVARSRRLLVLLNHYKPSSTLNRKQALVHGRASTREHLNPTIKSHLRGRAKWPRLLPDLTRKLLFERPRCTREYLRRRERDFFQIGKSLLRIVGISDEVFGICVVRLSISYYYNIMVCVCRDAICNIQFDMLLIPSTNLT